MKPRHETEIKLRVSGPKQLKQRVRDMGFRAVKARHFESNYLFDFPDQRLRKARCLLRVRFVDGHGIFTFKGAPVGSRNYKIRREIETAVADGHKVREILESLGLREVFCYEKYRTIYAPRGKQEISEAPHLVYDETPIGDYVELEGPERWIDQVAHQLGFSQKDYITASYGALYRQKCLEQGKKPGNMVFPVHKS